MIILFFQSDIRPRWKVLNLNIENYNSILTPKKKKKIIIILIVVTCNYFIGEHGTCNLSKMLLWSRALALQSRQQLNDLVHVSQKSQLIYLANK